MNFQNSIERQIFLQHRTCFYTLLVIKLNNLHVGYLQKYWSHGTSFQTPDGSLQTTVCLKGPTANLENSQSFILGTFSNNFKINMYCINTDFFYLFVKMIIWTLLPLSEYTDHTLVKALNVDQTTSTHMPSWVHKPWVDILQAVPFCHLSLGGRRPETDQYQGRGTSRM